MAGRPKSKDPRSRNKFSINLSKEESAAVDRFIELFNGMFISSNLKKATAIRMLMMVGVDHQDIVLAAHIDPDKWTHLRNEGGTSCGMTSKNLLEIHQEELLTCPVCIKWARHHPKKTEYLCHRPHGSSQVSPS